VVEGSVMRALAREAENRPATVAEWFSDFSEAFNSASITPDKGESRVVIMAPAGAEVYVDDERHGSIGRSGRVILKSIPPGKHVLRVAHAGDRDDERIIEVRPDSAEQIIQAQFQSTPSSGLSPSQGGSLGSVAGVQLNAPGVVVCTKCGSRFAAGTKFCGRCGNTNFDVVTAEASYHPQTPLAPPSYPSLNQPSPSASGNANRCTRCGSEQPPTTKFCGRCGASMGGSAIAWSQPRPVEVICGNCGANYPSGTKFCGRCGRTIK
jgi:ribosomal protein L40E